jgi:hypothetical protein
VPDGVHHEVLNDPSLALAESALGQLAFGHVVLTPCRNSGSPCSSVTNVVSSCTHYLAPISMADQGIRRVHEGRHSRIAST